MDQVCISFPAKNKNFDLNKILSTVTQNGHLLFDLSARFANEAQIQLGEVITSLLL